MEAGKAYLDSHRNTLGSIGILGNLEAGFIPVSTPNMMVWRQQSLSTMSHTRGADYPGQPVRSAGYACFDSICADHALSCCFVAQWRHEIAQFLYKVRSPLLHSPAASGLASPKTCQRVVSLRLSMARASRNRHLVICIHGTRAVAACINRGHSLHAACVSMHFERTAGVVTT